MGKRILSLMLVLSALVATCTACASQEPVMPEPIINNTEKPERPALADNYYGYANYDFLSTSQIPNGRPSYRSSDKVEDAVKEQVFDIIDRCVADKSSSDTYTVMVRELYSMYNDYDNREKEGITPLLPIIGLINECKTTEELVEALGVLYQEYGVSSVFRFIVAPDTINTSKHMLLMMLMNTCGSMKENFTRTDAGSEQIGQTAEQLLKFTGVGEVEAKDRARAVVKMVNEVMVNTLDSEYENDMSKHYTRYNRKELSELLPNCYTDKLLSAFGFSADEIVVYDTGHVSKINELFTDDNLQVLKDYAVTCIANEYRNVLPPSYMNNGSNKELTPEERDENAKSFVGGYFTDEVGVLYGREICTEKVMAAATKMLDDIKASMRELIQNSSRLSEEGKTKHLKKLDNMIVLLGYDKNYQSPLTLIPQKNGGTLLTNYISFNSGKSKKAISTLKKDADRTHWNMTPIEVNAVYNPSYNSVCIPAVMLSKNVFDPDASEYTNLGYLGYVVAHEINHAFDSQGYLHDENGNYNTDWMSESDKNAYIEIQSRVIDYYHNYHLLDMYSINGKVTLGENIADLGAVQCISNISDKKEDLVLLYESIASQWAELMPVTELMIHLESDVHSPPEARVNAVLSSTDRFYEAYDVKEGSKMYVAPEDRIRVW